MKVLFISILRENQLGVLKKIKYQSKALNSIGCDALVSNYENSSKLINDMPSIINGNYDVLYIRHFGVTIFRIWPMLIALKLKGVKVIFDIPTPFNIVLSEIKFSNSTFFKRLIKKISLYIIVPMNNLLGNANIQYANESKYFNIFSSKVFMGANFYDVSSVGDLDFSANQVNPRKVKFIAVANFSIWHGLDRFLYSIAEYYEKSSEYDVYLDIVGAGSELPKLKALTDQLNLNDFVTFHGMKNGTELTRLYLNADIALSSLGCHRIKMYVGSILKNREYAAYGLPIVVATGDTDFSDNLSYIYKVESNENIIDIKSIKDFFLDKYNYINNFRDFIKEDSANRVSIEVKAVSFLDIIKKVL